MSAGASQPGEGRLGERVAILVNPTAGRGRAPHLADALEAACRGRGASVWRQATQRAGDGVRLARELPDDIARVFVLGGDGTLREVAAGVLDRAQRPALGHIPLGNANVVAREMGIPLQGEAAIAALLDGELRTIDILRVGEQVVLAMVGVGYDAETAQAMERARSGPLRRWYSLHGDSLYGLVGAWVLCKPAARRLQLEVDGSRLAGEFTGCIVSNLRTYAKGWAPNPAADPCDGRLDFVALRPGLLPVTALSLVAAARSKFLPERLATHGHGQSLVVQAAKPFAWQADGDAMGKTTRLVIEVVPSALTLIVPR